MKNHRKTLSILLSLALILSSVLGQMPEKTMTLASGQMVSGQVVSGGGITTEPVPTEPVTTTGSSTTTDRPETTSTPVPVNTPRPTENPHGIRPPVKEEDGVTTWDCIRFGNYWQNDTNEDGIANQRDEKEPIRWRVLSVYEDEAFLLADEGLDCQPYNTKYANVTWETSSLRDWLNNTFCQEAFSLEEQSAITTVNVENMEKDPQTGGNFRNDTQDKVYLLSITEVGNIQYGFDTAFAKESKTRCSKGTAYARAQGARVSALVGSENYIGNVFWMLRSSTYNTDGSYHTVALVGGGGGSGYSDGCTVNDFYAAIRPVIHINLSSDTWSKAGYVTSDGESYDPPVTPDPTVSPSPTPTLVPTPTPTGGSQLVNPNISQKPDITDKAEATSTPPSINTNLKDSKGVTYTVTKSDLSKGEVAYSAPKNKTITSAAIPATVKIKNITYKVTSIKANAFKNNKKLKKVTIGKNVKSIGKNAFSGCSKLKNIVIRTAKLTNKSVGSKAFAKIHKQAQIKVPKKKLSAYKKILKKKGISGKKQTIKK